MDNELSPREIQSRIRSGASIQDLVAMSESSAERIEAFALPVLAEREHIATTALQSTIRRRGDAPTHRRLGELINERLRARGIDPETVTWDAWRLGDLRWRVVATLTDEAGERTGNFIYDPKGRFSLADNADARWMIGEDLAGSGPDHEITVDFGDEFALVRATQPADEPEPEPDVVELAVADEADLDVPPTVTTDPQDTSELDALYDLLSGVSEDSVRMYIGYDDAEMELDFDPGAEETGEEVIFQSVATQVEVTRTEAPEVETSEPEPDDAEPEPADTFELGEVPEESSGPAELEQPDPSEDSLAAAQRGDARRSLDDESEPTTINPLTSQQDSLIEGEPPAPVKKAKRRRAQVPSWDEIMFGGKS